MCANIRDSLNPLTPITETPVRDSGPLHHQVRKVARALEMTPSPPRRSGRERMSPQRFQPYSKPPKKKRAVWPVTQDSTGKVQIGASPKSSKKRNVVYLIERSTPKKGQASKYVGSAVHLGRRFNKYRSIINGSTNKPRHIESALRRSPTKFQLSILKQLRPTANRLQLLKAEAAYIQQLNGRYNHGNIDWEIARERERMLAQKH